ncbi:MAG TPA: hypothetical protein VGK73_04040 [Polyangiaceae bacterium]
MKTQRPTTTFGVLRLPEDGQTGRRTLVVRPAESFRPQTLLLWGTTEKTFLRSVVIGGDHQIMARLPGHLFESEVSRAEFESLCERFDAGGLERIADFTPLGHFFWLDFCAVPASGAIELEVQGAFTAGAFLGYLAPFTERAA